MVLAAQAVSVGISCKASDYAEDIHPDGTFSLMMLGLTEFEVKTTKIDGTASVKFGPCIAQQRQHVTYLGLLSCPRENRSNVVADFTASTLEVVVPALEFPPHDHQR